MDNILVTGDFTGIAIFGAGEPNETSLTKGSMFVAKYAPNGSLIWTTQADGNGAGIAVGAAGNSVVTGSFWGEATFGAGESNQTVLTTDGEVLRDIFVAKYASNGSLIWATQARGEEFPDNSSEEAIAVDASGNSLVTGFINSRSGVTFGRGEPNETVIFSSGFPDTEDDIFVAKYKSTLVIKRSDEINEE
jgi:hypothetical protein